MNARTAYLGIIAALLLTLTRVVAAQETDHPVVFVCEHGSVKSPIAASLFDRTAEKRGLPFRAVSRGVNPEEHVPPASVDYPAARAPLQRHIDALLDELQKAEKAQ